MTEGTAKAMCAAVAKGDTDTFGQLVTQSPDALFAINADHRIPIEYAKDVDTYGAMLGELRRRSCPHTSQHTNVGVGKPRRAQPRSFRHLILANNARQAKADAVKVAGA